MSNKKNTSSYNYTPSFKAKEEKYILYLQNNIQPLFLKFIEDKNQLNPEEKEVIFKEMENMKLYLKKWIKYEIQEDYNTKSALEKKLETLYFKIRNIFSNSDMEFEPFFEENLEIIIDDAIFEALGVNNSKKVFKQTNDHSNILFWCHSIVFYKTLSFMDNELLKYQTTANNEQISSENYHKEFESKIYDEDWEKMVEEILNEEEINLFIPYDILPFLRKLLLSLKIDKYYLTEEEIMIVKPYSDILLEILKKKEEYYEEILFF